MLYYYFKSPGVLSDWKGETCNFIGQEIWLALLVFREMTPAYQRAARSTSGSPARRRMNTRRRPKRPWIRKTAFLTVRNPDRFNLQLQDLLWSSITAWFTNHSTNQPLFTFISSIISNDKTFAKDLRNNI